MNEGLEYSPKKHFKKPKKIIKFDISEIEDDDDTALQKFEFLDVVGEGAFGKVYKAQNRKTRQECAIKV